MADYFSPTVVQPTIPNADMTPLERLLLMQIFESEPDGDGLYFFAEILPAELIELPIEALRNALAASDGVASETATFVLDHIKNIGEDNSDVAFDLSMTSWEFIFQDIVKRSATLDHVSVLSAFTCTRMRADGFGGMAILITADAIRGKSSEDILFDFMDEAEHRAAPTAPGFGVHTLLCLNEQDVRAEIGHMVETDEALATTSADAVTDANIRAGCLPVVEQTNLSEERGSAVYRAAMAAMREPNGGGRTLPDHPLLTFGFVARPPRRAHLFGVPPRASPTISARISTRCSALHPTVILP